MAAELGHQAAAGAVPQPPANQLFERACARGRSSCLGFIAVLRADDSAIAMSVSWATLLVDLGLPLGADFAALRSFSALASSSAGCELLEQFVLVANCLLVPGVAAASRCAVANSSLGKHLSHGKRRLPTVVAGQVAAMPLGADVVDVADQALA